MAARFNPSFDPHESLPRLRGAPDMDFSQIDYSDPSSMFRALGAGLPGGLPMPEMISADQVRKQTKEMSSKIFSDWHLLNALLDRHEATIGKRWGKKTKNQRAAILLVAWPKMAATHRPDFLAFRRESVTNREAGTKFRDACMWPYINLEDLAKPKILPLFLQARARNTPDEFAHVDENAAHLGYVTKAIVPLFLNCYTMMFTNRTTPSRYGELVAWEDNDEAFEWMHTRKEMQPGAGLLILEMQQRIMRFLVDCCRAIMHDIPSEKLTDDEYTIQPPVKLSGETVDGFASLAVMAMEALYRPPASLDLARLDSLLAAKVSASEDHIWALREDPSYFSETLLELKEHRQEMMKDSNGKEHPIFRSHREEILWARVIKNVVANASLDLEMWTELHGQVVNLRKLQSRHAASISVNDKLPEEYPNALLKFQFYLQQASKGPLGIIKHHAVASPPLRPYFFRHPPKDTNTTTIRVEKKPNLKLEKPQAEFMWLFGTLLEDGQQLFLVGLTNVVDELQRLIQSEPKAKEMLSAYMATVLGDLAVITEALRQIDIYQPWANTFEDLLVDRKDGLEREYGQRTADWSVLLGATDGPSQSRIVRLGDPSEGKFYYPVDKRRTKENVQAMRTAERHLDDFWLAVDESLQKKAGKKLDGMALRKLLLQPRILQRTPEWIEPDKNGSAMTQRSSDADMKAIMKPLSELYFDIEYRTERTVDRSTRDTRTSKAKTKTQGTPAAPLQTNGQDAVDAQPPPRALLDIQPTFAIDARALRVLNTLFYIPSVTATPGEFAWTDFLHAMVSTGFIPEKLYGSVWQFSPTKLDVERSIQFHEPHPSGKLAYRTARRFGRRLERAYGWLGKMFVLAEK